MTVNKTNIKKNNHNPKGKGTKKKKNKKTKKRHQTILRNVNIKVLYVIIFLTTVFLIIASYAWFSASLNVRIKFFDLVVSTDNGLFISLDGVTFSDSVDISLNSIITDLKKTYPNHTNQWSATGLWPVSTNGIKNANSDKFSVYLGQVSRKRDLSEKRYLTTKFVDENIPRSGNVYIAFDVFLKNISGSPKNDNLYFDEGTGIEFTADTQDDVKADMSGIINSMRIGLVIIGSVPNTSDVNTIQNIQCNNRCTMLVYEPNSTMHSAKSVENIQVYGVSLADGVPSPTYAIINEGTRLEHVNGHEGTGIPLDTEHFAFQRTITNFNDPIYSIPNGISKFRVYVWIEGQDMDSLETSSKGAVVNILVSFIKDLAGYE